MEGVKKEIYTGTGRKKTKRDEKLFSMMSFQNTVPEELKKLKEELENIFIKPQNFFKPRFDKRLIDLCKSPGIMRDILENEVILLKDRQTLQQKIKKELSYFNNLNESQASQSDYERLKIFINYLKLLKKQPEKELTYDQVKIKKEIDSFMQTETWDSYKHTYTEKSVNKTKKLFEEVQDKYNEVSTEENLLTLYIKYIYKIQREPHIFLRPKPTPPKSRKKFGAKYTGYSNSSSFGYNDGGNNNFSGGGSSFGGGDFGGGGASGGW